MPKIKKLPSGNWNVRIYEGRDENGKQIFSSITKPTKDEVVVALGEYKKSGKNHKNKSMTVREAIEKYVELSAPVLSPTTIHSYEAILQYAFESLMDEEVKTLSDSVVQNAINRECKRTVKRTGKPISAKTVKNEWGLISSALNQMCNVSFRIKLPKVQHTNESLPNPQDVIKAIIDTEAELPALLSMFCSLRLSEIRGLTCDSIHGSELWVDKVLVEVGTVPTLKDTAKTDASIRKVQIPPYVLQLINNTTAMQKYRETGENGFIVPMTRNMIYHHFTHNTQKAGIKMSFHDLRHLYASISLTILGIPSKVVQTSGGWSSSIVLDRVYSQTFAEENAKASEKINDYLEKLKRNVI